MHDRPEAGAEQFQLEGRDRTTPGWHRADSAAWKQTGNTSVTNGARRRGKLTARRSGRLENERRELPTARTRATGSTTRRRASGVVGMEQSYLMRLARSNAAVATVIWMTADLVERVGKGPN